MLLRRLSMQGLLFALLMLPAVIAAQTGTVSVERENLRAAPNGNVLGEVLEGTELAIVQARDQWREATLEGWIWSASVRAERRDGHDLVVTPGGGENLRAEPNGDILARLRPGALLDRIEAEGNWTRVRRTAWVWGPSLQVAETSDPGPAAESVAREPGSTAAAANAESLPVRDRDFASAGSRGLVVLTQPAGDTLARVHQGATVEVLAREGDWARVRVEGWAFTAGVTPDDAEAGILRNVSRSDLAREPDRFRGRLVEWSVQFIALQQAERFRTDFIEGEPFILAKGPGDDAGFVYVAIPPERLEEVRRLPPLQRIQVMGRIRNARSSLTDAPVVDLLDLTIPDPAPRR